MSTQNTPDYVEAISVACVQNDKILLIKRAHAPSEGLWCFPGGKVKPGESLEAAAARELQEETALVATHLTKWTIAYPVATSNYPNFRIHVFKCIRAQGKASAGSDAEELSWFSWEDSMHLPLVPGMQQHIQKLLLPM